MTQAAELAPPAGRAPRRRWPRLAAWSLLALLLVAGGFKVVDLAAGSNCHCIVTGKIYRSAQLSPKALEACIGQYGIRTVLNLRGCSVGEPWYAEECRVTARCGVAQEDVTLSASRYPSRTELYRLVEVADHAEYPMILHCRRGADRTGVAAAVLLLLQEGVSLAEGRHQLGLAYGHVALGRTGRLDRFVDLYEEWLSTTGREHSAAVFRDWVLHGYRGGHCSCVFERAPKTLSPVRAGEPWSIAVRVRNDAAGPWHFKPLCHAGIHIGFVLSDLRGRQVAAGRGGLFEGSVDPGQAIDLTVALPASVPGRYLLLIDMIDEEQGWFYQMGSEPLVYEVTIGA